MKKVIFESKSELAYRLFTLFDKRKDTLVGNSYRLLELCKSEKINVEEFNKNLCINWESYNNFVRLLDESKQNRMFTRGYLKHWTKREIYQLLIDFKKDINEFDIFIRNNS